MTEKLKPRTVDKLIDAIISHNEIVAIWEDRQDEEGSYHYLLWRGMAHQIPKEYLNRDFDRIFGTVPENISEADTINIAVYPPVNLS